MAQPQLRVSEEGGASRTALEQARELYDRALVLAANEPSALANRAVCALYLGCARACIDDCAAALKALEVEAEVAIDGRLVELVERMMESAMAKRACRTASS